MADQKKNIDELPETQRIRREHEQDVIEDKPAPPAGKKTEQQPSTPPTGGKAS
jgi:hypothetical protein